jgi:glycosyltransferase involved in cell wall biosynthesis
MPSPTICIDCSPLLVRSAGVKTYIYHWLKALRQQNPAAIHTFLEPKTRNLIHEGGIRLYPVQIATLLALNRLPQFFSTLLAPRSDIFHASNLLRNIPKTPKLTATIHDMTPWSLPECHTPANIAADNAYAERVLKRADGLIAVSENTKRDAIRVLNISPGKIRVIHLGIPPSYRSVTRDEVARVTLRLALHKPYFLSVGTIEPRKNVDNLLTAWQTLPPSFRENYDLIVAGPPGWNSDATTQRLKQANADNQGVRYLGYVPEPDLPPLTAGATAFIYPSLYEGFGIPVAQAMAAGSPVITSGLSSLPEITGGAAVLIDPRSVTELTAAIRRVGDSPDLRARLQTQGIEQAKNFTWEKAAAESLRYFSELTCPQN